MHSPAHGRMSHVSLNASCQWHREKRHEHPGQQPLSSRSTPARSADPEGFWGEAAREIDWIEPAKKIFDPSMGLYGRWFAGAVVNTCYNALDRHVAGGRADQVALIHDSPLAGTVTKFTYAQMLHEVKTLAAVMQDFGVAKGDRVILYMPMVPEAVVAMLACARIGAVHSRGVRRLCRQGTRDPDRGRQAEADLLGELRARARPHRAVQAAARRGDQAFQRQARGLHHPAAAAAGLRPHRRARSRLGRAARQGDRGEKIRRLRAGAGDRSALHPLHLGHDRQTQGRGARQWRASGRR